MALCGTKNGSSVASLEESFEAPLFMYNFMFIIEFMLIIYKGDPNIYKYIYFLSIFHVQPKKNSVASLYLIVLFIFYSECDGYYELYVVYITLYYTDVQCWENSIQGKSQLQQNYYYYYYYYNAISFFQLFFRYNFHSKSKIIKFR